jgi:hypothetical protein
VENQRVRIDNITQSLKVLDSEIRELEKMIDFAESEVKAEYQQQINELFFKEQKLQKENEIIEEASGNVWDDLRAGSEMSWKVLDESMNKRTIEK